ncbi:hypothetical protein ACLOJK_014293 [Asimina triloba]
MHSRPSSLERGQERGDYGKKMADEEAEIQPSVGSFLTPVRLVKESAEEILLLWAIQQPTLSKHNSFVRHSSLLLDIEACGHPLTIHQSPSSMSTPGVTGAVMWDSGVVLGKFLEHAVDSGMLLLQGKKVVELGSGCGLVGCIAALLGAQVIMTDLPDRLKLLKKNVQTNVEGNARGSATVTELQWGDEPESELIDPLPDFEFSTALEPGFTYVMSSCCRNYTTSYVSQCGFIRVLNIGRIGSDMAVLDPSDPIQDTSGFDFDLYPPIRGRIGQYGPVSTDTGFSKTVLKNQIYTHILPPSSKIFFRNLPI